MAEFVPSQKYASDFNKAKKYENGDAVQAETVNNLIEGQLFVQGIASNQPRVEEDNTEGQPIVYFENKDGLPRFVFRNIRGKDGKMGEKGDNGNIMRFTDSALYARSDVGTLLTIGSGNLINGQNVAVGDVVLDIHYQEGENYYICIWEVINVSSSNAVELRGMDYISSTGGGGTVKIEVDNELITTSENPVQNKVITKEINDINTELTEHDNALNDLDIRVGAVEEEVDERAKTIEYSWESFGANGINPFKLNLTLKDANGNQLSTTQIDFPLEQMVVNAEYDKVNKKLILYLPDTQIPVPVEDIFDGLVTDSNIGDKTAGKAKVLETARKITFEGDVTGEYTFDGSSGKIVTLTVADDSHDHVIGNIDNLQGILEGYDTKFLEVDTDIGQLQDEKLDKSGGIIYNPNSTTDAPLHIRANNQACYLGFRNNTGEAVGYYGFSASGVPQVAIAQVGIFDLIHSNNIGSQNVYSAKYLSTPNEYGILTDEYGNFRQITATSGACWNVFDVNGTSRFSVYFDDSGARVGTNEVLHAGNYETYIRNYMNKKILEQPY